MSLEVDVLVTQVRACLSMPHPKERWCSETHVRPDFTTNCWQILYLIEREARPHPDLTLVASPFSPASPHTSLPSRNAMA